MFYKPRLPKDYIEERRRECLRSLSKDQFKKEEQNYRQLSRRFLNEQEALDYFDCQKAQMLGIKKD